MADRQALTDEDWTGGFHELALIWPDHDDARLTRATAALWSATGFTGDRPAGADFHVRGTAPLPSGPIFSGVYQTRLDDSDRLVFYIPLTALERSGAAVDPWLADIGAQVHEVAPIRVGLIGWEVDDVVPAPLAVAAAPEERPVGFLLPDRSRVGLRYYPATE
ncbi:hypothetical protein ACFPM7_04150 [Actinokineospora guangxiensis]|uniref:DUF3168 domain-containing protein n=1 Tax=Actinokineospora guangxiensis TaxID=1490288 RepID=A0ABW0EJ79_9PSEU